MKKRSEVVRARIEVPAPKSSAAERTVQMFKYPDIVHCEQCDEDIPTKGLSQRQDGALECSSCGAPLPVPQEPKRAQNGSQAPSRSTVVSSPTSGPRSVSERSDTTQRQRDALEITTDTKQGRPNTTESKFFCGECGAQWPIIDNAPFPNCGHKAQMVDDPRKAKKFSPPAGHARSTVPIEKIEIAPTPLASPVVTLSTNRLSITWGEARCPVDQFNNFKCGGFIASVELGPNDDRVSAARQMLADLQQIADLSFDAQKTWYLKKLGMLNTK